MLLKTLENFKKYRKTKNLKMFVFLLINNVGKHCLFDRKAGGKLVKSKEVFSVEGGGGGYAVRIEDYKATAKWQVKEQQEEEEEKTTIQKLTTFNLGKP